MTLSNKLTLSRICLTPLFFLAWFVPIHLEYAPRFGTVALWVLFLLSEITDIQDGRLARRLGQVSDTGKLLDPFSDIFLRITYFVCFMGADLMPIWILIIILWRELSITFIRMLLLREGVVLAASKAGKLKAVLYAVSGFWGLFILSVRAWFARAEWLNHAERASTILFIIAAFVSLISFIDHFRYYMKTNAYQKLSSE